MVRIKIFKLLYSLIHLKLSLFDLLLLQNLSSMFVYIFKKSAVFDIEHHRVMLVKPQAVRRVVEESALAKAHRRSQIDLDELALCVEKGMAQQLLMVYPIDSCEHQAL